jgi:FkbM family methyltransferase
LLSIPEKLQWRAGLFFEKLRGQHPNFPWSLTWRVITTRRPVPNWTEVVLLEHDPDTQMVLLKVGDHCYWYPSEASREMLVPIHEEVFNPQSDHFYECRGASLFPDDVVLDAGACEGFFVRYAIERGARVLAVEPWSLMADCLERTFAQEITDGRVQVLRTMLGADHGRSELTVDLDFPFGASAERNPGIQRCVTEIVPVTTIDALVEQSTFGRIDFIKMDIEGAERDALAGAGAALHRFHPRLSITTYHQAEDWTRIADQIRAFVPEYRLWLKGMVCYEAGGYRPVMLHGWSAAPPRVIERNSRQDAKIASQ